MLFLEAHVDGVDLHLNKGLTVLRLRTGFYGCHIPAMSKLVKSIIDNCVICKKKQLQLQKVPIGDKFGAKNTQACHGLFHTIGLDILGPYRYKAGPVTRANQTRKAWALMVVCHLTSAVNFGWLESYSTTSLMSGLLAHVHNTRMPALVTGDAGSQIKSAARRETRSSAAAVDQTPMIVKSRENGPACWTLSSTSLRAR